jgi:CheY-like chemotaxis protein
MTKEILVIDDDATVRAAIRQTLERAGFAVAAAEDGKAAMRLLALRQPDFVITDLIMPEQDGIETIMQIRRFLPRQPILAISGFAPRASADFLRMAKSLGATAVLPKPFNPEELIRTVEECWLSREAAPVAAGLSRAKESACELPTPSH